VLRHVFAITKEEQTFIDILLQTEEDDVERIIANQTPTEWRISWKLLTLICCVILCMTSKPAAWRPEFSALSYLADG